MMMLLLSYAVCFGAGFMDMKTELRECLKDIYDDDVTVRDLYCDDVTVRDLYCDDVTVRDLFCDDVTVELCCVFEQDLLT